MTRYRATPPPIMQQQTGPLGQLGNMALQKGLSYGINAAVPGGGFAAEAAQQILPGMIPRFNRGGGVAPLGGGQSKAGLEEARRLGALTQQEFLKAMAHAGYMNKGGKVGCGPLAGMKYKTSDGTNSHEYERKFHNPMAGGSSKKEG